MKYIIILMFFFTSAYSVNAQELTNIFVHPSKRVTEENVQTDRNDVGMNAYEIRGAFSTPKFTGLLIKITDKRAVQQHGGKEHFVLKKGESLAGYTFVSVNETNAVFQGSDNSSVKIPLLTISNSGNTQTSQAPRKTVNVDNTPQPSTAQQAQKQTANAQKSQQSSQGSASNTATEQTENNNKTSEQSAKQPEAAKNTNTNQPPPEKSEGLKKFLEILKKQKQNQGNNQGGSPADFFN